MLPLALALAGAGAGYMRARNSNKRRPSAPAFERYSGYRPPHVSYLRPVEDMITKTTMRRSQGEDVGYDPARREALLNNFDIQQNRDLEDTTADIKNRLSGMGLSRNAAANDEILGRALREAGREKNLYRNRVDIEDLARRNEERDLNTQRLQNLNTFNFGQENKVADFDLSVYGAENTAKNSAYSNELQNFDRYQDPLASALAGGFDTYNMASNPAGAGAMTLSKTAPSYDPYYQALTTSGPGFRKDTQNKYLDPALRNRGQNYNRG